MKTEKKDPVITFEMSIAGGEIASNLMSASVSKSMGGLGGSKTWQEWVNEQPRNQDLIFRYLEGEISSVDAIYLAMHRIKEQS